MSSSRRVLVLMSGSIAAYKVCHVLSRLKQAGHEIEVVASPSALRFIGEATIEGLTARPVHKSMYGSGAHMSHIDLIRWADVAIVCPATANTINKLAQGVGDDLITTLFLAHDFTKPWLIAPAMNTKMYHHPATRASVEKLKAMGCEILETASGVLACGEIGDGKLLDSELLLAEVVKRLPKEERRQESQSRSAQTPGAGLNILITSGGTREPIDPVRSITNTSTGKTGAQIAEAFLGLGHRVHFLTSKGGDRPKAEELGARDRYTVEHFDTFRDLESQLHATLAEQDFDAVIHAAAVSDYSLAEGVANAKLDSKDELTLKLKKNPKLLDSLKSWSRSKKIQVVAFKLTAESSEDKGAAAKREARLAKIAKESKPDFVVANDLASLPAWTLYQTNTGSPQLRAEGRSREDLALTLESTLNNVLAERSQS